MKTILYFIKIFFLILFNNILDISIFIGIKIKKFIIFIGRNLKKLVIKVGSFFKILLNKIKKSYPIIKNKIGEVCFDISDYFINLKYKIFIWYLKSKEKKLNYDKIYSEDAVKYQIEKLVQEEQRKKAEEKAKKEEEEKLEKERLEKERLEQERIEKEKLEQERLEQEKLEAEKQAKIEEEKRLEAERLEQEKLEQEKLEKEKNTEQPIIEDKKEKKVKTKSISISKIIKGFFVLLFWFLIVGIALTCIVLAENTFLGIDLDRQFLYNIDLLTRDQAKMLILAGMFFSLVALGELLVFLYKFITCKPILNTFKPSRFTLALIFSYFSGFCFIVREDIQTSIDSELIKNTSYLIILEKVLPIIAIILFLIGAIELMISLNNFTLKGESNDK